MTTKPQQLMEQMAERKFLTYPAVIDWLQWAEFPEKLGDINGPQVTLLLIKEYRDYIAELERKLAEKDAVISHLKYQRDNYANKAGLLTDENSRMDDAELAELEKGDKV